MLGALLLTAVLVTACGGAVWLSCRRAVTEAGHAADAASAPAADPRTLEDTLTLELVRGEITGRQYREAMAAIAARDTERNPLDVPPDVAPPGPA